MATVDVSKITKEFMDFELDPGKLDTNKVHSELLAVRQTVDLSSLVQCRQANALVASLIQVIGFKTARCHYWERVLGDQLKYARLLAKRDAITANVKYTGSAAQSASMDETAELNENVMALAEKLSNASAARYFWEHMETMVHDVAKRVDSAAASLGVEAKLKNIGG